MRTQNSSFLEILNFYGTFHVFSPLHVAFSLAKQEQYPTEELKLEEHFYIYIY